MTKIDYLTNERKGTSLPYPKEIRLYLKEYSSDADGTIFLSNVIVTPTEAAQQIDLLVKQLDELKKKISKSFSK